MDNVIENNEMQGTKHSTLGMLSYSTGFYVNEFIQGVLIFLLFYFYEVEIGLATWMTGLGMVIYGIWDAVNDPLLGFVSDKPTRLTKRWGRRFPWIVIGFVPTLISFLLIFYPPNVNPQEQPWIIFAWFTITLCIFDTCETIFTNNYYALYPDKYRTNKERTKVSAFSIYMGILGVVFANLLPPSLIEFGNKSTYITMAWICITINFFVLFLMIPGVRDDKESTQQFIENFKQKEKESLTEVFRFVFKHKSLFAFLFFYMLYLSLTTMVQSSFLYWIRFIIYGNADDVLYVMILLLIGVMVGIPLWMLYNKKTGNNRRTMIMASIALIVLTVFFTILTTYAGLLILAFIWGMGFGGFWMIYYVVYGDIIDEAIAETGVRREGLYSGLRRFFGTLSTVIQAISFTIVHELTGFVETSNVQSPSAQTGILLLFGIIPAVLMAIGFIIFLRFYDITPEKSKIIKEKLAHLKV